MMEIWAERPDDVAAIWHVNERAFGSSAEARLVDQLRAANKAVIALVAQHERQVAGHILFSPVIVTNAHESFRGVGLAPMSVLPGFQNQGIGSRLIRDGLIACRAAGYDVVVVLGHVGYSLANALASGDPPPGNLAVPIPSAASLAGRGLRCCQWTRSVLRWS
jgi:putative acetyltransferase